MKAWLVEQFGVELFNTVVGIAAIAMPLLILVSMLLGGIGWWFGWFDPLSNEDEKNRKATENLTAGPSGSVSLSSPDDLGDTSN